MLTFSYRNSVYNLVCHLHSKKSDALLIINSDHLRNNVIRHQNNNKETDRKEDGRAKDMDNTEIGMSQVSDTEEEDQRHEVKPEE